MATKLKKEPEKKKEILKEWDLLERKTEDMKEE